MEVNFNLNKPFECEGYFWLPKNKNRKLFGILKFEPGKKVLIKIYEENLINGTDKDEIPFKTEDIILGYVFFDGMPYKLTGYKNLIWSLNGLGLVKQEVSPYFLFINSHLVNEEEIKFKSISINFSHLNEWFKDSLFGLTTDRNSVKLDYERPEPWRYKINDELNISFEYQENFNYPLLGTTEFKIKVVPYIRIEANEERSFREFFYEKIFKIKHFLTLIMNVPLYINNIFGFKQSYMHDFYILNDDGKAVARKESIPINILIPYNPHPEQFEKFYARMISYIIPSTFSGFNAKYRFNVLLNNWLSKYDKLRKVIDTYINELYTPTSNLENQFLNLLIAIEGYHRLNINNEFVNYQEEEEDYNKRKSKIIESLSEEDKKWLEDKLKHANERTLRRRLKDLFKKFEDIFNLFVSPKQSEHFINDIIEIRTPLVHPKEKENKVEKNKLYQINENLKLILKTCILYEIGLDFDDIKSIVKRSKKFQMRATYHDF